MGQAGVVGLMDAMAALLDLMDVMASSHPSVHGNWMVMTLVMVCSSTLEQNSV